MKVKELIFALADYNLDADVTLDIEGEPLTTPNVKHGWVEGESEKPEECKDVIIEAV